MSRFKPFLRQSVRYLIGNRPPESVSHLEDYLLKDIGLERVGGRIQPIADESAETGLNGLSFDKAGSEDPPR